MSPLPTMSPFGTAFSFSFCKSQSAYCTLGVFDLRSLVLGLCFVVTQSAGALNAYIYLIMDAQLNIQNGTYVSAVYKITKMFMKELHTALFIAPTGVGKTHLALSLLETEYRNHFDFIVIICPTLRYNSTYKNQSWVWNDPDVIPIEPGNQLYYLIEKISNLLTGDKTLFLIDDIIADETLDKHHQPLLELAISGRQRGHSLWLLTQSYTAVPNNIRRQAKMLMFGILRTERT